MEGIAPGDGHDAPLRIHAWRRAQHAGVVHKEIRMAMNLAKGIHRAAVQSLAHWARGEEMDGHQVGRMPREFRRDSAQVILILQRREAMDARIKLPCASGKQEAAEITYSIG